MDKYKGGVLDEKNVGTIWTCDCIEALEAVLKNIISYFSLEEQQKQHDPPPPLLKFTMLPHFLVYTIREISMSLRDLFSSFLIFFFPLKTPKNIKTKSRHKMWNSRPTLKIILRFSSSFYLHFLHSVFFSIIQSFISSCLLCYRNIIIIIIIIVITTIIIIYYYILLSFNFYYFLYFSLLFYILRS